MAKKRSKQKRRIPDSVPASASEGKKRNSGDEEKSPQSIGEYFASKGVRETIESVAIAFIFAFFVRTFEAEAFVIPTGSMAETLRGRHVDMECEECGFQFIGGASGKQTDVRLGGSPLVGTTCPMCRHVHRFEPKTSEYPRFTGDRLIVSKFAYDMNEPQRWDVIVFKFPFKASENYIKRLVGLPNETLRVVSGDVWVKPLDSEEKFTIARKPPEKITAMMQNVHDSHHRPQTLSKAGWPARWQKSDSSAHGTWSIDEQVVDDGASKVVRREFTVDESSKSNPAWLRYYHYTPMEQDWSDATDGEFVKPVQRLISDFYGYNAVYHLRPPLGSPDEKFGLHWVGDLILEAEVEIEENDGSLLLDLVEAGRHYQCEIDLSDGTATLSIVDINGNAESFSDDDGETVAETVTGKTGLGRGKHQLRLANVDNLITLWVDGDVVSFDGPTTYLAPPLRTPDWNANDDGDLAPAGIGSAGGQFTVKRLKLFRDIYYIAQKKEYPNQQFGQMEDYDSVPPTFRNGPDIDPRDALEQPREQRTLYPQAYAALFDGRRSVEFAIPDNKFFTMGDNSPQSLDARIWDDDEHYVDRNYLIGKAMFIYWPHATGPLWLPNPWDDWKMTFPLVPNPSRMQFVR